jgi:phenylpyruvate tautomerase PptA (4-oxalocrotonate tautomerase family)
MPHVSIKHFPVDMTEEQKRALVDAVATAALAAFRCPENAISIAVEPVSPDVWKETVYDPEIMGREEFLLRRPGY